LRIGHPAGRTIVRQIVDAGTYRIAYQVEDVIILQYLEPGM
jgi:hypothetical protein